VQDGEVLIRPVDRHGSRAMVTDLMLMAGEAAARWCGERGLPIPYATQPPPDSIQHPEGMAAMFAYRRQFKPSRTSIEPGPHFGLGLEAYARATSPLRRYADLLVHQQIRARLCRPRAADAEQVSARAGEADQGGIAVRRAERQSNQHWKLAYLLRHKDWQGEGVVVELGERKDTVMIPELALETKLRAKAGPHWTSACASASPTSTSTTSTPASACSSRPGFQSAPGSPSRTRPAELNCPTQP
jgi:exoribonuclease-2